jgi:hypothetical protein
MWDATWNGGSTSRSASTTPSLRTLHITTSFRIGVSLDAIPEVVQATLSGYAPSVVETS